MTRIIVRDARRRLGEYPEWRLGEHFFRAMFDFGFLSDLAADSFKRVLIGSVGAFIAFGLLLTRIYMATYARLRGSPEEYRRVLLGDDMMIIGLPMLLVAFVTMLVSHSLFPDERDFRILGPLPLRRVTIFRAKLVALALFTGLFTITAHVSLLPLMLVTSVNPGAEATVARRLAAWALASLGASAFSVLAVTALVGVLVLALSRSRLQAVSTLMRSVVLGLLVVCLPLVSHLPAFGTALSRGDAWFALVPPAWFLGLQRVLAASADPWLASLAAIGLTATATVAATVVVAYVVLYRHFERLMLRPALMSPPWWRRERLVIGRRATPAYRGAHGFTVATVARSQLHQGVLVGISACGMGVAIVFLTGRLATAAAFAPFALMFACGIAARAAIALPIEYRANWIFQVTEDHAMRREQMRAVDRVVTTYVIAVPLALAAPLSWMAHGLNALLPTLVVAAVGFVFVHAVLLDWRRIPFTCSYLPGKRFIGHSSLVGVAACILFSVIGAALVSGTQAGPRQGLLTCAALLVLGWWLRQRRLAAWQKTPLMFEDEFPDRLLQLEL